MITARITSVCYKETYFQTGLTVIAKMRRNYKSSRVSIVIFTEMEHVHILSCRNSTDKDYFLKAVSYMTANRLRILLINTCILTQGSDYTEADNIKKKTEGSQTG